MPIDVNGLAILRAIVGAPEAFPDIAAEINKAARTLVVKQLKSKSANLERLRRIYGLIEGEAFVLILDGLTDAETKSLAAKLDKNHPDLKSASAAWRRQLIGELASGAAEPTAKPAKTTTKTPPKAAPKEKKQPSRASKPKVERALNSKAMAARWDGKERDE
jgi:hypothetical protein